MSNWQNFKQSSSQISLIFFKVPAINRNEKPSSEHSMTWTEYHEQDDVESFLDYLANTYDFVEVESIGESYEGRPMRVVKVG